MADKKAPIFLARKSYQRRRLRDASRVLPVAGLVLFMIPLFWLQDTETTRGTADAMTFVFAVWFVLVVIAALLGKPTQESENGPDKEKKDGDVI